MSKPAQNVHPRDCSECLSQLIEQRLDGRRLLSANPGFQFGKHHFDRVEIGAIWRQIQHATASRFDQRLHGCAVM